jgi:hypothetical protein
VVPSELRSSGLKHYMRFACCYECCGKTYELHFQVRTQKTISINLSYKFFISITWNFLISSTDICAE